MFSYNYYSLLFLPVCGIEPATSGWFHSEALSNYMPYPLCHISLPGNSEWIFGTYKPNVSINPWDSLSPLSYRMFFSLAHIPKRIVSITIKDEVNSLNILSNNNKCIRQHASLAHGTGSCWIKLSNNEFVKCLDVWPLCNSIYCK